MGRDFPTASFEDRTYVIKKSKLLSSDPSVEFPVNHPIFRPPRCATSRSAQSSRKGGRLVTSHMTCCAELLTERPSYHPWLATGPEIPWDFVRAAAHGRTGTTSPRRCQVASEPMCLAMMRPDASSRASGAMLVPPERKDASEATSPIRPGRRGPASSRGRWCPGYRGAGPRGELTPHCQSGLLSCCFRATH